VAAASAKRSRLALPVGPGHRDGDFASVEVNDLITPTPGWEQLLQKQPSERGQVRIHLVGIAGSGLAPIASFLLEAGYRVSGSDRSAGPGTQLLAAMGATVALGHKAEHVAGADLVLISSAVPSDNVEVQAAHAQGITVVKRSAFLGPLMRGRHAIAVAGTHGKTTTTSMLATILYRCGFDPSYIVGGSLAGLGMGEAAGHCGEGPLVIEADEYDRMFLGLEPETAIITYVEWDHVDCYPTPESFAEAFRQFVQRLPENGRLILCADEPGAAALRTAAPTGVTVETYGLSQGDWQARSVHVEGGITYAEVWHQGVVVGKLGLPVPGVHNISNALAAIVAAAAQGISPDRAAAALGSFTGAGRRFEVLGEQAGITVIDDYGHHPTEIRTTLAAARLRYPERRIWAVFQPHTYSRLAAFLPGFAGSFIDADQVLVLDVYAARETDTLGITSERLLAAMAHPAARYVGTMETAVLALLVQVRPGDVVITLSAGTGNQVGLQLLEALRPQPRPENAAPERLAQLAHACLGAGLALQTNEPLSRHSTFRIGGPADLLAAANSADELIALRRLAHAAGVPCLLIGGGSNMLISDAGAAGLVILNHSRSLVAEPQQDGTTLVIADSGVAMAGCARWCIKQGLAGMEWAVSIPGTVGGAVVGNAGAHNGCTADLLEWVELGDTQGQITCVQPTELGYSYRSSRLRAPSGSDSTLPFVIRAAFRLKSGTEAELAERADAYLARRRATQPTEPSAGSIFRNPPGEHAGQMIEAAGLKGAAQGGAQISPCHANFIINNGTATAQDVVALIELARQRVYDRWGIELVPEILFVGRWDRQPPYAPLTSTQENGSS
jgi:UDP-N-acetylmuramate--alanine ligase